MKELATSAILIPLRIGHITCVVFREWAARILEKTPLKKYILALALILTYMPPASAQDVTFTKSTYSTVQQSSEIDVNVSIKDSKIVIEAKKPNKKGPTVDIEIPYSAIDSMSYEEAALHRIQGAGMGAITPVIMSTKTQTHWLEIDYHDGDTKQTTVIHLDKSEYKNLISTLEAKSGKPVTQLEANSSSTIDPAAGSEDIDEVVPFGIDKVLAALKPAMETYGCNVTESTANRIECKRARGYSQKENVNGNGGESVTATVETQGDQTRVRIATGKGFYGRLEKKNWSTPIYNEVLKGLRKTQP
jgi:hypothetical protein